MPRFKNLKSNNCHVFILITLSSVLNLSCSSKGIDTLYKGEIYSHLADRIKDSTVLIKRNDKYSSGIIIDSENNSKTNISTYTVLTARHSVENKPSRISIPKSTPNLEKICPKKYQQETRRGSEVECSFGFYSIFTNDKEEHYVNYSDIDKKYSKKWDIAIIKFESRNVYENVLISDNVDFEATFPVYVSGYRGCGKPEKHMSDNYELTSGIVKDNSRKDYNLFYSNPTINGMSGGGVFDKNGALIAIHQKAEQEKQYDEDKCLPLSKQSGNLGDNWGTIVSDFLQEEKVSEDYSYTKCDGQFIGFLKNSQCSD